MSMYHLQTIVPFALALFIGGIAYFMFVEGGFKK